MVDRQLYCVSDVSDLLSEMVGRGGKLVGIILK